MFYLSRCAVLLVSLSTVSLAAQQPASEPAPKPTTAAEAPNRDTSYIDEKGTAHVTRVVPVPQTVSTEAQHSIGRAEPDQGPPQPLSERRKMTEAYTARARVAWTQLCPNGIVEDQMAGVPVRIVTPEEIPAAIATKCCSICMEADSIRTRGHIRNRFRLRATAGIKVVAALYRLVAGTSVSCCY